MKYIIVFGVLLLLNACKQTTDKSKETHGTQNNITEKSPQNNVKTSHSANGANEKKQLKSEIFKIIDAFIRKDENLLNSYIDT